MSACLSGQLLYHLIVQREIEMIDGGRDEEKEKKEGDMEYIV